MRPFAFGTVVVCNGIIVKLEVYIVGRTYNRHVVGIATSVKIECAVNACSR